MTTGPSMVLWNSVCVGDELKGGRRAMKVKGKLRHPTGGCSATVTCSTQGPCQPPSPRAPLTMFQATASHLGLRPRGRLWGQCQGELRLQAVGQWWPHLGRLQRWLGLRRPRVRSAGGLSGRRER